MRIEALARVQPGEKHGLECERFLLRHVVQTII